MNAIDGVYTDDGVPTVDCDGARIPTFVDALHAGHRARCEKGSHRRPVVRWPIGEPQDNVVSAIGSNTVAMLTAQIARGTTVRFLECVIEAPQTTEPRRHGDLGDAQTRFIEQAL